MLSVGSLALAGLAADMTVLRASCFFFCAQHMFGQMSVFGKFEVAIFLMLMKKLQGLIGQSDILDWRHFHLLVRGTNKDAFCWLTCTCWTCSCLWSVPSPCWLRFSPVPVQTSLPPQLLGMSFVSKLVNSFFGCLSYHLVVKHGYCKLPFDMFAQENQSLTGRLRHPLYIDFEWNETKSNRLTARYTSLSRNK